jgi:hypothetical protein
MRHKGTELVAAVRVATVYLLIEDNYCSDVSVPPGSLLPEGKDSRKRCMFRTEHTEDTEGEG